MNGDPIYYCAICQRMIHGSQVANGTHRVTVDGARGYRFATHTVTALPTDDRPIVVRLTEEEARLTKHAIGFMVLNLLRESQGAATEPINLLSGIVVRLQLANEAAAP